MRYQLSILIASLIFVSCASAPSSVAHGSVPAGPAESEAEKKARDYLVVRSMELIGQKPNATVVINGRTFMLDCIGTVSAAYWSAGYDIQKDFAMYGGNGVNRLYKSLQSWAALHQLTVPKPGDIIFWSNTYDRNENGILDDDGITHAGIVVKVDEDGTVSYMHESVTRGVVIAYFNLLHPDSPRSPEGKIWNSPMYLGSNYDNAKNPPHWLSGDLWSAFGDAGKTMNTTKI
jgi:hypothetical protein